MTVSKTHQTENLKIQCIFISLVVLSLAHRSSGVSFLPKHKHVTNNKGTSFSSPLLAFQQNLNSSKNHHNHTRKKNNNSNQKDSNYISISTSIESSSVRASSTNLNAQRSSRDPDPNFSPNFSPYGNQHPYMNSRQIPQQQQPPQHQQQYHPQHQRQYQPRMQQQPLQQQQQQQQQQPKYYPPASDRYTPPYVEKNNNYNTNNYSNNNYSNNSNSFNHYKTSTPLRPPSTPVPQQPTRQYTNGSSTSSVNGNSSTNRSTLNNYSTTNYNTNGSGIQKFQRNSNINNMNPNTNLNRNRNTNNKTYQHDHIVDAAAYNEYISKAVDIDSVTERNGILTVIRSCRDIDNNTKRKFISYYNLVSLASAFSPNGLSLSTASASTEATVGAASSTTTPGTSLPSSRLTKLVQSLEEQQADNLSSTMTTSTLSTGEKVMTMLMPPVEMPTNVKARIISPSGNKIAVFIKEKDDRHPKKSKQIVEIWTAGGVTLIKRIVLPHNKLHGDICFDTSWFGSISWNHDETALVYAAEMKSPSTKSYFHVDDEDEDGKKNVVKNVQTNGASSSPLSSTAASFIGATNELGYGKGEDWGEKYTSTCRLNLYILNIMTNKVGLIENVPGGKKKGDIHAPPVSTEGGFTMGQPVFSPCGNYIVYTAWDAGGGGDLSRRLGSIYCYQRPSKIYASSVRQLMVELANPPTSSSSPYTANGDYASFVEAKVLEEDFICVTQNDRLARSPRFCKSSYAGMKKLVYLCNTDGFDTHNGAMALHSVDWNNAEGVQLQTRRTLVDIIQLPTFSRDETDGEKTVLGMSFPGLFMNQLPENCFSQDGRFVLTTTQWGSITKIIRIDVETGEVKAIDFNLTNKYTVINDASQRLLCLTSSGDAVVSQSSPSKPAIIGIIPSSYLTDNDVKVKPTIQLPPLPSITATSKFSCNQMESSGDMACHLVSITPGHGDVKSVVQGILLLPLNENGEEEKKVPLIVVPHGGPHSCTQATYSPSYAYLCEYGKYAVLHVNYRGSIGFGQTPVQGLAGNVGSQDIDDVVQLTERVLYSFTAIDPSRVGICGGSHGGFLAGHAIGQYPNLFKVAAMRNPVTNIATMVSSTDIPDWCYVEALGTGKYDWETFKGPTPLEMTKMWESSPIAHINQVTAPTLIALGNSDRRVPPSQGMEYYHALRSMGITTKLLAYDDDDHAIDTVQSEADHWINIKQWFDEHI